MIRPQWTDIWKKLSIRERFDFAETEVNQFKPISVGKVIVNDSEHKESWRNVIASPMDFVYSPFFRKRWLDCTLCKNKGCNSCIGKVR